MSQQTPKLDIVIKKVTIDRTKSITKMISAFAADDKNVCSSGVANSMPKPERTIVCVDVTLFFVPKDTSERELAEMYAVKGLQPDPQAQFRLHEVDPGFADSHPTLTQWLAEETGPFVYCTIYRWGGELVLYLDEANGNGYADGYWAVGTPA